MSPATASRRRALRRLVEEGAWGAQRELVEALEVAGFSVTQATVSRDLDALGAVKDEVTGTYTIPTDSPPWGDDTQGVARAVADFVDHIAASGNLVVLHTPPGAAHLVASALDHGGLDGVLGTVAGDDTVLVVAEEQVGGGRIARRLERIGARR